MFCIAALIVLSILGIFSATHRQLAKEALDCVLRRVTLRPCTTGFKEKMKGKILGKLLNRSVVAAKLFNKYFEVLAWILMILMVWSTVWSVRGVYNFYFYGSCNGLNQSGFCVFDPTGSNNQISQSESTVCPVGPEIQRQLNLDNFNSNNFPRLNGGAKNKVVFIGCYSCDYTRQTFPIIKKLLEKYKDKIDFTFAHFPVKGGTEYLSKYDYCVSKENPDAFWKFNDALFASTQSDIVDSDYVDGLVENMGMDKNKIQACVADPETQKIVEEQEKEIISTGIYGTPTVFVNGTGIVGPKPYRVYRWMLE